MNYLIIILITLIFSAFFSGMEIAFISSNKFKIELEKKRGLYSSRIISIFTKHPAQYIATMLVGNNIALVIYGIVMAIILEPAISKFTSSEITILLIQTIVATIIILITAEFLPKTLFMINPNIALNIFAVPVLFFFILFYPIVKITIVLSNTLLKNLLKVKINTISQQGNIAFGKVDLSNLLEENQNNKNETGEIDHDIKIFRNALDFSKVKLRECMVPRTEITALDINDSIENLKQKFIETGFSKILIYKDSIDNIIGYVHSSELFKNPESIKSMLLELSIVPETMPANKLLTSFIDENKSIAIIVDEFGGTSGMVTIEDIIEEIFGEIEDEHDTSDLEEKQISENEFIFSGRMEIDFINEKYKLNIPESDEYETLAGFILHHHENIPNQNENIIVNSFNFKILKLSKIRIELVLLKVLG